MASASQGARSTGVMVAWITGTPIHPAGAPFGTPMAGSPTAAVFKAVVARDADTGPRRRALVMSLTLRARPHPWRAPVCSAGEGGLVACRQTRGGPARCLCEHHPWCVARRQRGCGFAAPAAPDIARGVLGGRPAASQPPMPCSRDVGVRVGGQSGGGHGVAHDVQDYVGEGGCAWRGAPRRRPPPCSPPTALLTLGCQALIDFVKSHHSYDCPEVILTDVVKGNPGYLSFVHENTASPEAAE